MSFLARKSLLAIGAVVDVALHAHDRPVSAKSLAERHHLPTRHLEPVLQALVHHGILKGTRGPRGGYELARESKHISVGDILHAVGKLDPDGATPESDLVRGAVVPVIARAEQDFAEALHRINVHDIALTAVPREPSSASFGTGSR